MHDLANLFKALSDETRLEILALLLVGGELCVCDVEGTLGITQSKASRHLRYLLHAGLVENRRVGVWMHYLVPPNLDRAREEMLQVARKLITGEKQTILQEKLDDWLARSRLHTETDCPQGTTRAAWSPFCSSVSLRASGAPARLSSPTAPGHSASPSSEQVRGGPRPVQWPA